MYRIFYIPLIAKADKGNVFHFESDDREYDCFDFVKCRKWTSAYKARRKYDLTFWRVVYNSCSKV